MLGRGALGPALAASLLVPAGPPGSAAAQSEAALSLAASSSSIHSGQSLRLTGTLSGAGGPSQIQLWKSSYPFRTGAPVAATGTDPRGGFSFRVAPDRDSLYAVVAAGAATPLVYIRVTGRTRTEVRALALGRARVAVVAFHPPDLHWGGQPVSWWFAPGWHGRFTRAPRTRTVRLGPNATELSDTVALPAGHFRWRACFHAPGDRSLENPRRPPGCTGLGYHGGGYLPEGFPGPAGVASAERFLAGRAGRASMAVLDSEGRLSGADLHGRFPAASVVKAMLLAAYLRRLAAGGQRRVDSYSDSFLYPMIHVSDNAAATRCWSIVGNGGLYAVARAAGMTDFSVTTDWGSAMISAADQVRFFFLLDSLIPPRFVGYARFLLSTIDPSQSWGIAAVARPLGYQVFFKGGWRPNQGQINQVARLEGHGRRFAIAVLTLGPPGMGYGIGTIQGVAGALLG